MCTRLATMLPPHTCTCTGGVFHLPTWYLLCAHIQISTFCNLHCVVVVVVCMWWYNTMRIVYCSGIMAVLKYRHMYYPAIYNLHS